MVNFYIFFVYRLDEYCIIEASEDCMQPMKCYVLLIGCYWYSLYTIYTTLQGFEIQPYNEAPGDFQVKLKVTFTKK